jgi:hypothetical protein
VDEPGSGVQDAVAQRLRLGFGQVAVQAEVPQPGQQRRGEQRRGQPRGIDRQRPGRYLRRMNGCP